MLKKLIMMFVFICGLTAQSVQQLNSSPLKENAVQLKEVATLMDEEDGFYDRTTASIAPNGTIVIGDAGNKVIHVYDQNYKHITRFGKEGNGPGEIDRIGYIKATSDRIYVSSWRRLIIFKYDGSFIDEINLMQYGSSQQLIDDNGVMVYFTMDNPKYKSVYYDQDGKELRKVVNVEYKEPEERKGMRMVFFAGGGYIPYGDGYLNKDRGEYNLEVIDKDFQVTKKFTKTFTRIPRNFDNFSFSLKVDGANKKKQEQMQKAARKQMMETMGKFKDDVASILGVYKDYIFLQVADDDEEAIYIDVISPEMKYYTQIKLKGDKFQGSRIEEGKLLVNYTNDDDGPYVKIYEISMI